MGTATLGLDSKVSVLRQIGDTATLARALKESPVWQREMAGEGNHAEAMAAEFLDGLSSMPVIDLSVRSLRDEVSFFLYNYLTEEGLVRLPDDETVIEPLTDAFMAGLPLQVPFDME